MRHVRFFLNETLFPLSGVSLVRFLPTRARNEHKTPPINSNQPTLEQRSGEKISPEKMHMRYLLTAAAVDKEQGNDQNPDPVIVEKTAKTVVIHKISSLGDM